MSTSDSKNLTVTGPRSQMQVVSTMAHLLGGLGFAGGLGEEDRGVLELHGGRDAATTPVVDPLNGAALVPAQLFSQPGGSAVVFDEFGISHKPILYTFSLVLANYTCSNTLFSS